LGHVIIIHAVSNILQDLNPAQQNAVQATDGPILIVAGPGSGKTRCLTHKAAYLIKREFAKSDEVLLVTFTNKAANEMKKRVHELLQKHTPKDVPPFPWAGTFHSTCARILRIDGQEIGIPQNFVIYDNGDSKSLIKKLLKKLRIPERDARPGPVLGTISSAKHELIDADEYQNHAYGFFQERVARVYPEYQKTLAENHALDFSDLIFKTVRLLELRPQILEKWQNRFHYILVDEYQDTNHAQYIFVKMLAQKHHNLCVVGDISQAIYSWRGADFRNILNFEKDWPGAQIFRLEQNYRSTQKIVTAAKEVIEHNRTHIALNLRTKNEPGAQIKIYEALNEKDEARYVARRIRNLKLEQELCPRNRTSCSRAILSRPEGSNPKTASPTGQVRCCSYSVSTNHCATPTEIRNSSSSFAVLYRTNAQSRIFEETFIREGIPYQLIGGTKFYERREIKDILSYLRIIENPYDRLSLERIINVPPRKIGKKSQEKLELRGWQLKDAAKIFEFPLQELINQKKVQPPLEIMDEILDKTGYLRWLDDKSEENLARIENIKELRSVASQFSNLKDFLENVALVQNGCMPTEKGQALKALGLSSKTPQSLALEPGPGKPTVTLMTIHAAKGLEFPVVFIVGMEEGLFPHSRAIMSNAELEEERRLCYVGITRAQKELHLTRARRRLYFGGNQRNEPSRFLGEIPEELIEQLDS